eukprot:m.254660 g.254660  ORF g.254660 m.254660 type:complete len:133 (+) comp17555_c0_seq12:5026-5424(+)
MTDNRGYNWLQWATLLNEPDMILLAASRHRSWISNVDTVDGSSILHLAVREGNVEALEALFKCGTAPLLFVTDDCHRDPIQFSEELGQVECTALLQHQFKVALDQAKGNTRELKIAKLKQALSARRSRLKLS